MYRWFFIGLMIVNASVCWGQNDGDTTIVLDKATARKILTQYKSTSDLKEDLVDDYSQHEIITDRPHVAETPFLVPKKYVQAESGFQVQKTNANGQKQFNYTYNNMLLRFGFSRRVEGRFVVNYLGTKSSTANSSSFSSGFSGITLGSKVFLFKEKGLRPNGTLLYQVALPFPGVASNPYRAAHTSVEELLFLFVNRICRFYDFEYNLGIEWDAQTQRPAYAYALNNELEVTHKLFFFAELYGYFYENSNSSESFNGTFTGDHRVNGGVYYRITKDLQFDMSGGLGLSKISPAWYIGFGLSSRFKKEYKK